METKWLVVYAVPYSTNIDEFCTYDDAKKCYEEKKSIVSNMEVLYLVEVKEIYKNSHYKINTKGVCL